MVGAKQTLDVVRADFSKVSQIYEVTPAQVYAFLEMLAGPNANPTAGQMNTRKAVGNIMQLGAAGSVLRTNNVEYDYATGTDAQKKTRATDARDAAMVWLAQDPVNLAVWNKFINIDYNSANAPTLDVQKKNANALRAAFKQAGLLTVDKGSHKNLVTAAPAAITLSQYSDVIQHYIGTGYPIPRTGTGFQGFIPEGFAIPNADKGELKVAVLGGDYMMPDGSRLDSAWMPKDPNNVYVMAGMLATSKREAQEKLVLVCVPAHYPAPIDANPDAFKTNIYNAVAQCAADLKASGPYSIEGVDFSAFPVGLWSPANLSAGNPAQQAAHGVMMTMIDSLAGGPRAAPTPADAGMMPYFNLMLLREEGYQDQVAAADPLKPAVWASKMKATAAVPAPANKVLLLSDEYIDDVKGAAEAFSTYGLV